MSYTKVVVPYAKGTYPTMPESQKAYLEQELLKLKRTVDSQAAALQEIKDKLAAASVLPIT